MARRFGALIDYAAAGLSIAAGVYLLSFNSAPVDLGGESGQSWFEIISHGIGIYFLGKGLFMVRSARMQAETMASLQQLSGRPSGGPLAKARAAESAADVARVEDQRASQPRIHR